MAIVYLLFFFFYDIFQVKIKREKDDCFLDFLKVLLLLCVRLSLVRNYGIFFLISRCLFFNLIITRGNKMVNTSSIDNRRSTLFSFHYHSVPRS